MVAAPETTTTIPDHLASLFNQLSALSDSERALLLTTLQSPKPAESAEPVDLASPIFTDVVAYLDDPVQQRGLLAGIISSVDKHWDKIQASESRRIPNLIASLTDVMTEDSAQEQFLANPNIRVQLANIIGKAKSINDMAILDHVHELNQTIETAIDKKRDLVANLINPYLRGENKGKLLPQTEYGNIATALLIVKSFEGTEQPTIKSVVQACRFGIIDAKVFLQVLGYPANQEFIAIWQQLAYTEMTQESPAAWSKSLYVQKAKELATYRDLQENFSHTAFVFDSSDLVCEYRRKLLAGEDLQPDTFLKSMPSIRFVSADRSPYTSDLSDFTLYAESNNIAQLSLAVANLNRKSQNVDNYAQVFKTNAQFNDVSLIANQSIGTRNQKNVTIPQYSFTYYLTNQAELGEQPLANPACDGIELAMQFDEEFERDRQRDEPKHLPDKHRMYRFIPAGTKEVIALRYLQQVRATTQLP